MATATTNAHRAAVQYSTFNVGRKEFKKVPAFDDFAPALVMEPDPLATALIRVSMPTDHPTAASYWVNTTDFDELITTAKQNPRLERFNDVNCLVKTPDLSIVTRHVGTTLINDDMFDNLVSVAKLEYDKFPSHPRVSVEPKEVTELRELLEGLSDPDVDLTDPEDLSYFNYVQDKLKKAQERGIDPSKGPYQIPVNFHQDGFTKDTPQLLILGNRPSHKTGKVYATAVAGLPNILNQESARANIRVIWNHEAHHAVPQRLSRTSQRGPFTRVTVDFHTLNKQTKCILYNRVVPVVPDGLDIFTRIRLYGTQGESNTWITEPAAVYFSYLHLTDASVPAMRDFLIALDWALAPMARETYRKLHSGNASLDVALRIFEKARADALDITAREKTAENHTREAIMEMCNRGHTVALLSSKHLTRYSKVPYINSEPLANHVDIAFQEHGKPLQFVTGALPKSFTGDVWAIDLKHKLSTWEQLQRLGALPLDATVFRTAFTDLAAKHT